MTPPAAVLLLGFVLGVRHATDPDHVVAVTTIVSQQRSIRSAGLIGAVWGVGHTLTILVVGGAIILCSLVIPPRVGLAMELCVALMLIALGILNLSTPRPAAHDHEHAPRRTSLRPSQLARSLAVGIVHGLAGSAAVALLVLATIHDAREALLYLAVFGAGTIAGMLLITSLISLPFTLAAERFGRINVRMAQVASLLSVALGLFLVYKVGVTDGLFSSAPHWTPE